MADRVFIIAFFGIHGSAKTTHAQLLCEALPERGYPAVYVHQMGPEGQGNRGTGRFFVNLVQRIVTTAVGRKDLGTQNGSRSRGVKRLLRRSAAAATLLRGVGQTRRRRARGKMGVMVFDRYAYDAVPRAQWWYGVSPLMEHPLLRLVPVPDLLFYMDVEPEDAWRRHKGQEWSLEQLSWQKEVYDSWLERLKAFQPRMRVYTVQSGSSIEDARQSVIQEALAALLFQEPYPG